MKQIKQSNNPTIQQSNNPTIKHFFLSALLALFAATAAEATWTFNADEKTLTDNNWTFTGVYVDTLHGKSGLIIPSTTTFTHADPASTVIDFSNCKDDPSCGYPVVAVKKNFYNFGLGATKFIAPDCVELLNTFQRDTVIEEVEVSPEIYSFGGSQCFEKCTALKKVTPTEFPNVTTVHKSMFSYASLLEGSFSFPNATTMGDAPFCDCAKITGVSIPKCTQFKGAVFSGCTALETVTISSEVTEIPSSLFSGCSSLTTINGLNGEILTTIGGSAFYNCAKLTNLPTSYPALTELGMSAFENSGLAGDISIPLVQTLDRVFAQPSAKPGITSVYAPSVTVYGNNLFKNCTGLTNVMFCGGANCFPARLSSGKQPVQSFVGCSALKAVTWVGGVCPTTTKPSNAFSTGSATVPPILYLSNLTESERTKWKEYCTTAVEDFNDYHREISNYAEVEDDVIGFFGTPSHNNKGKLQIAADSADICWVVEKKSAVPTYEMTVVCPDHVSVGQVLADGKEVSVSVSGTYLVKRTAKLTITYRTDGFSSFEGGSSEYVVSNVPAAETIPASVCDKAVIVATTHALTLDTTGFAAAHVVGVGLTCDGHFECVTNESVITWTVIENAAFTLVYTAEEDYAFGGQDATREVAYENGISADTDIPSGEVPTAQKRVVKWSWDVANGTCTDGNWTFNCTKYNSTKKRLDDLVTVNGVAGIYLKSYVGGSGTLDLTTFKADTADDAAAAGVENYDVIELYTSLFYKNSCVKKVIAPSVLKLDGSVFREAAQLKSVQVSTNIYSIGNRQFLGASALAEFIPTCMPELTSIEGDDKGPGTFNTGSSLLKGDFFLGKVTTVNGNAFAGTGITSVEMPLATYVDTSAFSGCSSLTNAIVPKAVHFANMAFNGCCELKHVEFDASSVTNLGQSCFAGCAKLSQIPTSYPNLQWMGAYAFSACDLIGDVSVPLVPCLERTFDKNAHLTSVYAPACVSYGYYAFSECPALTNVTVGGGSCFASTTAHVSDRGLTQSFFNSPALQTLTWLSPHVPTNIQTCAFSAQSESTDPDFRPVVLKVNPENLAGWEELCTTTKANFTDAHKAVANYAEVKRRAIGFIGTVTLDDTTGKPKKFSGGVANNICWVVDGTPKEPGFLIFIR